MRGLTKVLFTGLVVLAAVGVVLFKYWQYVVNPWTRDGQVRAQVVQITPRISGPIVKLPIVDNQLVKAGDVLFEIDPRTFKSAVDEAAANLKQAKQSLAEAKDQADRAVRIREQESGAMSEQEVIRKQSNQFEAEAGAEAAQAKLDDAQLDLEFTQVKASVDGYVTNLTLRLGSQAVENQPALALVDINSYWIHGYFRENYIEGIEKGNRVIVTLMSYPGKPLEGHVDSIGWGIAQQDGSTSFDLLPTINPTFEWIRLAQRVPVRVHIDKIPDGVELRVGTTASVLVMTGTKAGEGGKAVAAPTALQ